MPIVGIAPRMLSVKASPTAEISNTVRALTLAGHAVINLGEGELDFPTPEPICDAGIMAIQSGRTKYTSVSGTVELKAAIRRKFKRDNNLVYDDHEVIAGNGAKQLIFNAFLATLAPGDEIVIPAPYWVSYPDMVRLCDGTPVSVPGSAESAWKITPQALAGALTERTRWLVLNSPNNPSGTVYSAEDLQALAAVLRRHEHILVLSDDIYEHLCYEAKFATMAAVASDLKDRTLTVNGVSKAYSMTGWRLGFAGGPAWLVSAMEILQSQSTSNPSSISQEAAVAALNGNHEFLNGWLNTLAQRRRIVLDAVAAIDGVHCEVPPGAFYVFPDCTGLFGCVRPDGRTIGTDQDVASYLLEAAHVAVLPGSAFGTPGYLRIAYAVDTAMLEKACQRIVAACSALSRR